MSVSEWISSFWFWCYAGVAVLFVIMCFVVERSEKKGK